MTDYDFRAYLTNLGRSENTIKSYISDLVAFATWFARKYAVPFEPPDLTNTDVRLYCKAMLKEGLSPGTINRRLNSLKAFGDYAIELKLIDENPVTRIKPMPQQPLAPRWLDKHEQHTLIRESERASRIDGSFGVRKLVIVLLMLHTGLRIGELAALEMADLQLGDRSGRLVVRIGKGFKRREVPLNSEARRALRTWLDYRPEGLTTLFGIKPRAIQMIIHDLGRRAGLELNAHRLRHTCAKNLLDAGVEMSVVAAILGHGDLNTTRRYTIPGEQDLEKAVKLLED